jgi:hypothetical protein
MAMEHHFIGEKSTFRPVVARIAPPELSVIQARHAAYVAMSTETCGGPIRRFRLALTIISMGLLVDAAALAIVSWRRNRWGKLGHGRLQLAPGPVARCAANRSWKSPGGPRAAWMYRKAHDQVRRAGEDKRPETGSPGSLSAWPSPCGTRGGRDAGFDRQSKRPRSVTPRGLRWLPEAYFAITALIMSDPPLESVLMK